MTVLIGPKDVARRYNRSEKRVRQIARESAPGHRRHERWAWEGWDDPDLQPVLQRLENGSAGQNVKEWDLSVSSKNQVTVPVAALATLKVKAGDKLRAVVQGRSLILLPHPVSWADHYAGIAEGMYGQTDDEIDDYIRESRGEWEPLKE